MAWGPNLVPLIEPKVWRRVIVDSYFLDNAWISYEFPKGVVTKSPQVPLGGGHDRHKISPRYNFNSGNNLQFRKS
jgi:hypothetical protein